ncbi:hypothetical protein BP6252_03292 [Coleophoma cylindrospora]|uniref:Uncharacterized protein n=1 Tax=Coleophoma cylindrospora TaxID=1849047 RepID=A0A3D8S7K9_9HELO|nr:hypothetical protein BP6252_03292 [Coleophoma cylindrospora]
MSTRNPTHGTKASVHLSTVTTDPASVNNPILESAGAVASDSLAAESDRAGGGFSENRNSEALGVQGSNSTFANTNTSGATKLDPARDAESREDGYNEATYPSALGGQSKGLAVTNTTSSSDPNLGGEGTARKAGEPDEAPSYVTSQYVDTSGPKGKNLTEGGFTANDRKNASFNGDIGGKNDPGRLAEKNFQKMNAATDNTAGIPATTSGAGGNDYSVLKEIEA